jgi:hypothetical protein
MAFLDVMKGGICPQIEVTFDYTNDPSSGVFTWTDITPYVRSYSRNPVRTNEFDMPGPAGATLVLNNQDARFTPTNASGPYFGGLKPYRRFRVRALWNGVTYGRFWGYVTDWPEAWDNAGKLQTVTLQLVDAMAPLEVFDLQGRSFGAKLSAAALTDVVSAAGLTLTTIDTGNSTIVASGVLPAQSYAMQRIKDICATENGVCYADGSGNLVFHDRHHRLFNNTAVSATIGDGPGEIAYTNPQPLIGDVWPVVQVVPNGGAVQQASLAAGVASYFSRTLNFPTGGTYLASSTTEALAAAQYLSSRYGAPITRIQSVELIGVQSPSTAWPLILAMDTSSKVVFRRRPLVNGAPTAGTISLTQYVEGYGETVVPGQDWRVSVPLSPADIQSYWVLGDAVYGLLGVTTKLAY